MILFLLIVVRFPRTIKIVSMTSHCHFQHFQKFPWSQNWLKGKLTGNPCYILVGNAIVSSNVFLNYINQLSRNHPWNIIIFVSTSSTNQHGQSSHFFIFFHHHPEIIWFSHGNPIKIGTSLRPPTARSPAGRWRASRRHGKCTELTPCRRPCSAAQRCSWGARAMGSGDDFHGAWHGK